MHASMTDSILACATCLFTNFSHHVFSDASSRFAPHGVPVAPGTADSSLPTREFTIRRDFPLQMRDFLPNDDRTTLSNRFPRGVVRALKEQIRGS